MTMRALWLENQTLQFKTNVPQPVIQPEGALLKVQCAGICGTDLALLNGYYDFKGIPGHEFVATVIDVADSQYKHWVGKRVVASINVTCGYCFQCLAGRTTHCIHRDVLGIKKLFGAFADYLVVPINNLYEVPENIQDFEAVFSEPLAAALQILEQVDINPEDKVVIVGAGRLGQLIAQVLAKTGCHLLVTSRNRMTLQMLANIGIQATHINEISDKNFDVAVECSGSPAGFDLTRSLLRAGGTLVMKSTYASTVNLNLSSLVVDEITLVGSRCGPFDKALDWLSNRYIDVSYMAKHRYNITDGVNAFNAAKQSNILKVLLDFESA